MTIPSHVLTLWSAYSLAEGGIKDESFYEALSFGDSSAMADELGKLVLAGIKRATCERFRVVHPRASSSTA